MHISSSRINNKPNRPKVSQEGEIDSRESGNQVHKFAGTFVEMILLDCFGKHDADELCASGEEEIGFDRSGISGSEIGKAEGILEDIDRSLNQDSVFVKIIPMFCVSRNTGTGSEILLGVGVNASAIRRIGTGIFAGADSLIAFLPGFRANPFVPDRTVFTAAFTKTGELFFCQWTNRIAELIEFR